MISQTIEPSSTQQAAQPGSANPSRCRHYTLHGRQCRLRALDGHNGLCFRHSALNSLPPSPSDSDDLSKYLLPGHKHFSSSEDLREFLSCLLVHTTKGRVSPRRAAVLAYITNQLLHSHCVVQKEEKELDNQPQEVIFDLPRPQRDEPVDPERALYARLSNLYGRVPSPTDSDPAASTAVASGTPDKTK